MGAGRWVPVELASAGTLNRGDLRVWTDGGLLGAHFFLLVDAARLGATEGIGGSKLSIACDKDESQSMSASARSGIAARRMLGQLSRSYVRTNSCTGIVPMMSESFEPETRPIPAHLRFS